MMPAWLVKKPGWEGVMEFTKEQKQAVRKWAADGDTASAIQEKLSTEFGISITYMEVRFLLDDMSVQLKDKEEPEKSPQAIDGGSSADADGKVLDLDTPGSLGVSVSVDRITKPGSVVSGRVKFSDGVNATWMLDTMGRLALTADGEEYRPSEEDVRAFQVELDSELRRSGFLPGEL
jgi:hypothetical protein